MSYASPVCPESSGRTGLRSVQAAPYRIAALVAVAVAADQAFDPTSNHVPLCPLHALTGIWCPFCGGLRSAFELTRLHLRAALHYNAAFVVLLPVLVAVWLDWVFTAHRGRAQRRYPRAVYVAIVVALVAFMVVRNLPVGAGLRGLN